MKIIFLPLGSIMACAMACAAASPPTRQAADTAAAILAAREWGAERSATGSHYLNLATRSEDRARALMRGGDDEDQQQARSHLIRARADADLARALAQKARADGKARHAAQELHARASAARIHRAQAQARRAQEAIQETVGQELNAKLEAEQRARQTEAQAGFAIADLAPVAFIKKEERGMVISLSGTDLFAGSREDLSPEARKRLDRIASVLRDQEDRHFAIEGHTDSHGSDDRKKANSLRRARAVRDYLVSRGVDPDSVEAHGVGDERPVADNISADGRANNRRVEIVVKKNGENGHEAAHEKIVVDAPGSRSR